MSPCLPPPHPLPCHPPSLHEWPFFSGILCHFCFIFSPCVPLFFTTIKPFHTFLKFPQPPPRSRLLFHLSISFSLLQPVSSSLPLRSAHLQHIKIPFFFLQRIVQSLRDLLHSSMFSLPFLHICLPLSLCFGSIMQCLIPSIFSFVVLTHLYPF